MLHMRTLMNMRRLIQSSIFNTGLLFISVLLTSEGFAQQEPLLVPLTDVSTNKLPYIVAEEEGIFDKYGLAIQLYMTPPCLGERRR